MRLAAMSVAILVLGVAAPRATADGICTPRPTSDARIVTTASSVTLTWTNTCTKPVLGIVTKRLVNDAQGERTTTEFHSVTPDASALTLPVTSRQTFSWSIKYGTG